MEKNNTQTVFELLMEQPMRSGEIEESTSIPKTTLFRILNTMIDDKIIYKKAGIYKAFKQSPTINEIFEKMEHYHQQRLMDYVYRKMKSEDRLDHITEWYINSSTTIKGNIDDYNFDELLENITKATLKLSL